MERAVTEDLRRLAGSMYESAQEFVAARRHEGGIDAVYQLATPPWTASWPTIRHAGPDLATQSRSAHHVFHELLINVGNLPTVRGAALADAASGVRPRRADRRAQGAAAGRRGRARRRRDAAARYQDEDEPNFRDIAVRHDVLGNITGWIPTISNAFARIVDELMRQDQMEGAQKAARAGDRELVAAYCFEASRFNPQNFALLRYVPADTTIAAGTDRETTVKEGSTVFAATLSAMHDERAIDEPDEFRTDRPWSDYMLFGYGLHTCYGQQIVRAQLPALATALFEGPRLERARGGDGKLRFEGPFPSGLTVRFGD